MNSDQVIVLKAAEKLKDTIRDGRSFEAGQVKIVGLDAVRRTVGARWDIVGPRIRATSLNLIESCLGEDDVVIPAGDGFLVIYAQNSGRDFSAECERIQQALDRFYLGEEGFRALHAEVSHRTLDSKELVQAIAHGNALSQAPARMSRRLEAAYLPVWNAEKEAITEYWLAPFHVADGQKRHGYDADWNESRVSSDEDHLEFDQGMLARAVQDARNALDANRRCLVEFSVHASTIQSARRRSAYLQRLHEIPEALRPYLLPRIAEIEPGTPASRIAEWVHALRAICSRITIQLHISDRALDALEITGAWRVALVLPPAQSPGPEVASHARHIQRWSAVLKRQKIKFRLDNVMNKDLLRLALFSGIDVVSSETLWQSTQSPEGVKLYPRSQLARLIAPPRAAPELRRLQTAMCG